MYMYLVLVVPVGQTKISIPNKTKFAENYYTDYENLHMM